MELVEEMDIRSGRGSSGRIGERTELFRRVDGAIFCRECGRQYEEIKMVDNGGCIGCGSVSFVRGNFAAVLAGYVRLLNEGLLKKYYENRVRKNSGAKMNERRMVIWLMVKDGVMVPGDRKIESVIYKVLNNSR